MASTNTIARSLNDLGLAAWFGGSLMGSVGLNGAAAVVDDPRQRTRVPQSGWDRWAPVSAVAVGTHLIGATRLTAANKGRVVAQRGVLPVAAAKAVLTGAALAATAYTRVLGTRITELSAGRPVESTTVPAAGTPPEAAEVQRRLDLVQWSVPALTGAVLVLNARLGEQQRPGSVLSGVAARLLPGDR